MMYTAYLNEKPIAVLCSTIYPAPYNKYIKTEFITCTVKGGETLHIKTDVPVKSALIRPLSLNMTAEIEEGGVSIKIDKPVNFALEINENTDTALLVACAPEREPIDRSRFDNVIWFEKGEHEIFKKEISCDNTLIYFEDGARVHGKIKLHDCKNVVVAGLGMLTCEKYGQELRPVLSFCLEIDTCRNVEVRDITLADSLMWNLRLNGCDDVHIDNVKIIGCRGNSDGIDVCGTRRMLAENIFTRTWDDSLCVKALDTGDLADITFRHCTLWNDFARPIEVGVELRAESVRNVLFDDIDVIHSTTGYPVMGIHHGDRSVVSGITFRNIRIEDVPGAQMFDIRITNAVWNKDTTMGRIENIAFENISLVGRPGVTYLPEKSRLQGYDEEHDIRGVSFKNINYLGKAVRNPEEAGLMIMDFVRDVTFEYDETLPPLGHADTAIETVSPFTCGEDGLYRGKVRVSAENKSDARIDGLFWLAVSPVNTAEYDTGRRELALDPGEKTAFETELTLPAGRYILRVQADNPAVEPTWRMETLELQLSESPVEYGFVNYYNDKLAKAALSVCGDALTISSDVLADENAELVVYSAMPAEECPGEVKFTVEETDFGEAPAVLDGRHGLELAPQLRCPAEITYVFKNEPKVKEIRVNRLSGKKDGKAVLSFDELGLDAGCKAFWLEVEVRLPETKKYRYPYTLFHSVKPAEMAHMFAHAVVR